MRVERNIRHRLLLDPAAVLNAPLRTSVKAVHQGTQVPYTPTYNPTSANRIVPDHEGILHRVNAGEPRFYGARRVENLADHSDPGAFLTTVVGGGTVTDNGNESITFNCPSATDRAYISFDSRTWPLGAVYMISFDATSISNPSNAQQMVTILAGPTETVTPSSRQVGVSTDGRYAFKIEITAGGSAVFRMGLGVGAGVDGACAMTVSNIQLEEISGASVEAPNEYVAPETDHLGNGQVNGVKYFDTTHGNTWNSTTAVVTAGSKTRIADNTLKGMLAEPGYTNLWSTDDPEDILGTWTASETTMAQNSDQAPDGRNTAVEVTESVNNAQHSIRGHITMADETLVYTGSVYLKAGSGTRYPEVRLVGSDGSTLSYARINTTTGAVTASGGVTGATHKVWNVGNGWWRVVVTGDNNLVATGSSESMIVYLADTTTGSLTYTGDGTSSVLVWFGQIVEGAVAFQPYAGAPATDGALSYGNISASMLSEDFSAEATIWYDEPGIDNQGATTFVSLTGSTSDTWAFYHNSSNTSEIVSINETNDSTSIDLSAGVQTAVKSFVLPVRARTSHDAKSNLFITGYFANSAQSADASPAIDANMTIVTTDVEIFERLGQAHILKDISIWPHSKGQAWVEESE